MKLRPLENKVIILTVIVGILWLGGDNVIAQQQGDGNSTVGAAEQPVKIGEKTKTPEKIIITSDEFGLGEGVKVIWSITSCDGTTREVTTEAFDEIQFGDITLYKLVSTFGGKSQPSGYAKKSKEAIEYYPLAGGQMPGAIIRFPIVKGAAYEYQNSRGGKVKVRVEGPEEVNVPAGKFMCLVLVQETEKDGNSITGKNWVTSGLGTVRMVWPCGPQAKQKEIVSELKAIQMNDLQISNFDFDPLVSTAFARSKWEAGKGDANAISICEIDATTGANGTPYSMKWTYNTKGKDTWVDFGLKLSGSFNQSVDLSGYDSISFYVKGAEKKHCAFKIQTGPWKENRLSSTHFPLELTTEWQKVVIDLKTRPEIKDIDLTKTYSIELVEGAKENEEKSNVVWIDEIMLHKTNDKIKNETIDKEFKK